MFWAFFAWYFFRIFSFFFFFLFSLFWSNVCLLYSESKILRAQIQWLAKKMEILFEHIGLLLFINMRHFEIMKKYFELLDSFLKFHFPFYVCFSTKSKILQTCVFLKSLFYILSDRSEQAKRLMGKRSKRNESMVVKCSLRIEHCKQIWTR